MKHSKTKKFLKKGGYQAGPYASLMNKTSAYSRLGAEGAKVWNNGYILGSQSTGGPTKKAQVGGKKTKTKRKQFGGAAAPNYNEGKIVYYIDKPTKSIVRAKILKIHRDDIELYFTINIVDQNDQILREKQTTANKLIPFDLFDENLGFEIKQVV